MRRPPVPRLVLYALILTLSVAIVIAASTSTATFGGYNIDWDGTSEFRELADQQSESQIALETTAYERSNTSETTAIILAPEEPYTANDSRRVRAFVRSGGTVVIADDFGSEGNALLSAVGADARFNGTQLLDEREYYQAPSLPVATNVTDSQYTSDVAQLTLNGATAIDANGSTVLATSSRFGYLDRDGTGGLSPGDELSTYPVVTVESVGDGRVIAVSDPSVFINTMLTQPDNEAFATALLETHQQTLLDYSRAGEQPPLSIILLAVRSSVVVQMGLVGVGIGFVWAYGVFGRFTSRSIWGGLLEIVPEPLRDHFPIWLREITSGDEDTPTELIDEDTLLRSLSQRHPEWDETRLRQVMTDVLSERSRTEDDE
ncbi:hypothetical protein B9H04_14280 [Halorubrum ezzemoulense DSM 17463]|uniref:DUF4350 domain-containing protein n=1 Tax=Halorubrum ezzemoulense DSM 17463 TaxID=1121945 RepID=A0A1X4GBN9_HALEZ|nr:hypothetical protein B9H04_14280 [Halorubrum ezzemoulense DSM 17463]